MAVPPVLLCYTGTLVLMSHRHPSFCPIAVTSVLPCFTWGCVGCRGTLLDSVISVPVAAPWVWSYLASPCCNSVCGLLEWPYWFGNSQGPCVPLVRHGPEPFLPLCVESIQVLGALGPQVLL